MSAEMRLVEVIRCANFLVLKKSNVKVTDVNKPRKNDQYLA